MLIVLATPFALSNMATDIFPEINIPVVSVIWNYNGLPAQEMGQRVAGQTERGRVTPTRSWQAACRKCRRRRG
jgi:multidrug efflux pump subunit AcrB